MSRRIALGSIVGGLAGTALVIHSLKSRNKIEVPQSDNSASAFEHYCKSVRPATFEKTDLKSYVEEWNHDCHAADVPIKTIRGPSSFRLGFKPQTGLDFRVFSVCSSYKQKLSGDAKYPQPPAWYSVTKGRVTSIDPIDDDRLALLIRAEQMLTKSRFRRQEMPGGECVIVPYDFKRDYYEIVRGASKKIGYSEVNIPCSMLASWLTFRYPTNKALVPGTKWINPQNSDSSDGNLACQVVDFAEVAGRQTVKIHGEKKLSYKPAPMVGVIDGTHKYTQKQLDEEAKQLLNKAKKELPAQVVEMGQKVAYIDLTTGITLRQEETILDLGVTTVTITQVLNG